MGRATYFSINLARCSLLRHRVVPLVLRKGNGLWLERVFCEKRFQLIQPSAVGGIQFSGMAQGF